MKKLYYNGTIITLEKNKYAEGVLVSNGIIEEVYERKEDIPKDSTIQKIDLHGKTLMPAFIDAHSHISAFSTAMGTQDLTTCNNIYQIQEKLKEFIKENGNLQKDSWIIGFGYDNNYLEENRHPNKEDLDKITKDIPILIAHKSGHLGIANTKALKVMKITKETPNPVGGKIGHDENGNLTGYLEEIAFQNASEKIGKPSIEVKARNYQKAEKIYLSYGITTVQDGLTKKDDFELLKYVSDNNLMKTDVISYIDLKDNAEILEKEQRFQYVKHLKIGGFKLILDGSPQGRTAWLRKPYQNEENYRGYPIYQNEDLREKIGKALSLRQQVLVHCNGDAACEQMIEVYEKFFGQELFKPVMIHAQLLGKDQIQKIKKLGIIPSFFVAHTFYWGDIHIKNLGERAYHISPTNSCLKENIIFTLHQDTPVILPNMFETIWCAVNRKTKEGIVLGEDEKIPVIEALKAVTINVAYQYNEQDLKGSIKKGKIADFIIIDKNPLEIDSDELKEIQILKTIKDGIVVYSKE